MIIFPFAVFGALLGALRARRLGGSKADIAQYAVAYGIALALAGLVVSIIVERIVG